jgi:phosphate starvation-inducible PhoH-like protein
MAKKSTTRIRNEEEPAIHTSELSHVKLSHKQVSLLKTVKANAIVSVKGYAGTSKTYVACYIALDALAKGEVKRIILTKPTIESGEPIGFLPGTLHEKIAPYMESFVSNMEKIIGKEKLNYLVSKGIIEMRPFSYMRGVTFDDAFCILDEAQNSDLRQLILFVTRMGSNSKIMVCGDTTQYDRFKSRNDFADFFSMLEGISGVAEFSFEREDIRRHPILIEITDRYDKKKYESGEDR